MRILRKLAECTPEGKLRLTPDALNEIRWVALDEIEFMDDGVEKLRMYLKYADFCNETFLDEEARDYYELVLDETLRGGVVIEEYRELAEYAYQKYAGLTFSDDDYVWETVSQRIEQYRSLLEKNRMKQNPMDGSVNKWEVTPKELVKLCDGEYWLPVNSSRIFFKVSDICPNGSWNDCKRVFGTGKQTLSIEIEYDYKEEEKDNEEVWMAIYRVGQPKPLWANVIRLDECDAYLTVKAEMESEPGLHFIMMNHVELDDKMEGYEHIKENAIQLPYGVRYDFIVEPDGCSLIHPEIREIEFTPRPLSEWKKKVKEHYLDGTTMGVQLVFQRPFDLANNYLQLEIFDEALNWIAWSDYASEEGYINVLGFYPILDGEYQFVVFHNRTPVFCGKFACCDGICKLVQMTKWSNGNILEDILDSRSHANDLKFRPTTYGRRLKLLEDIQTWSDDESCLEGDCLDKLLAEQ